jgi:hypothetical protein
VIDWSDPQAAEALVSGLVNDANALVAALAGTVSEDGDAAEALALLALVAGQDVEPAEGSGGTDGRWRIASQVAGDRIVPVVDPMPGTPASTCMTAPTGIGSTWPPSRPPESSPMRS